MANYLREPYSADLDFGTGEWSASAWVNVPSSLSVASTGPELLTNNTFDTDTSGWTSVGVNTSITAGVLTVSLATWVPWFYQAVTTVIGKTYVVTMTGVSSTQKAQVFVKNDATTYGGWNDAFVQPQGSSSFVFTATAATTYVHIWPHLGSITIDSLSLKEAVSPSIVDRNAGTGASLALKLNPTGKLTATAYDGTTTRTVTTTAAYNTASWLKAEACYTTDGTLSIRVNGQQVAATYGAPLGSLNNSNAVLTIGNSYNLDAPFPGSLALLKLSATVPTAEQSQWMYEQEKQMFREGAQVTLPDSNAINDLTYDEVTDKWIAVSSANMSEWSGLVRTNVTAVPSGSYSKLASAGGVTLQARSTTNPGVDITIPSYGLRKELVKRAEATAKQARTLVPFDYVGGFTANTTNGATSIASVASLTYPTSYIGAQITGTGIQAGTVITSVNGTTIYISKPATATGTAVQISFTDFILPAGYEAKDVLLAGVSQKEGSTAAFTRLFDGFKETIRFTTAPNYAALVQIKAARSIQ